MNTVHAPITLEQMIEIAYLAGGIMKTYFTHFGMERVVKTDTTPFTKADTEINELVIRHVRKHSKTVDIIGEEDSSRTGDDWQIMCDPVDGTFPYSWGMPLSTFMMGLSYRRQMMAGVIYDPFMDRMYYAARYKGAWMRTNGANHRLKVSSAAVSEERNSQLIVGYVSWPGKAHPCPYNILKVCQRLEDIGATLVNFCSIGYIEAAVATGEFAATLFPGEKHHDTAPGQIIVEEAGGRVTDVFGKLLDYHDNKIEGHIMSNGQNVHEAIVAAVRECQ